MSETPEQAYISKVHLKGYKSIRDLEIDFKPGLNIIIGPNGSGKTNFLELINLQTKRSLNKEYSEKPIPNIETQVTFFQKLKYNSTLDCYSRDFKIENTTIKSNGNLSRILKVSEIIRDIKNNVIFNKDYSLSSDGIIDYKEKSIEEIEKFYIENLLSVNYLTFNNPLSEILKHKIVINVYREEVNIQEIYDSDGDFVELSSRYVQSMFIRNIGAGKVGFIEKVISSSFFNDDLSYNEKSIRKTIDDLKFPVKFSEILSKFTPISDVAFDLNSIISDREEDESIDFDNVFLTFSIHGNWIKWDELSDGTKRMFYIFGNVYFSESARIILIEEPELGIHPDQLHKLMDFLIEQSKEKQIIITTHSPEVLNAIHPDELDRIIVTRYDAEKGTVMRKLSPEQAKKMGERIKQGDMFLSDRWVHLNLEDEIFNAAQLNEK